ncbi:MAG: hypothetical protein ABIO70_13145 [Pseudomonadota bacterium]
MSRSSNLTIGCVAGGILTLGVVVCGGGLGLVFWGLDLYETEVCDHLGEQPTVIEALGALRSCEAAVLESGEIADKDTFVFLLEGSRHDGRAYVQSTSTGPGGSEEYQGILLEIDGERLLIEGEAPPID